MCGGVLALHRVRRVSGDLLVYGRERRVIALSVRIIERDHREGASALPIVIHPSLRAYTRAKVRIWVTIGWDSGKA